MTLTGAGVVACGVCCAAPIAWPALVAALGGSGLAWIPGAPRMTTVAAAAIVLVAWTSAVGPAWRSGRRPSRATLAVLTISSLAVAVAWLWPSR